MSVRTPAPRVWTRYVAIGDSFTEGMCDPDPVRPGEFVGWADRLAGALAGRARAAGHEFEYANLAIRGKLLAHITGVQLPAALELAPDLVSVVGGGNDLLRPGGTPDRLLARLETAVERVRATGADVLMATGSDPRDAPVLSITRGKVAIYNAGIWSIAARHGCHVLDLWGMRSVQDWRLWAPDRIHLTTQGHERVARAAAHALGVDPERDWAVPLPAGPRVTRVAAAQQTLQWLRSFGAPWVQRRITGRSSGDGRGPKRPLGGL